MWNFPPQQPFIQDPAAGDEGNVNVATTPMLPGLPYGQLHPI